MDWKKTRLISISGLMALAVLLAIPLVDGAPDTSVDDQIYATMMQAVGQTVASNAAETFGIDSPQHCIANELLSVCLAPGTPPERAEELLRNLPTWSDEKYELGARWTTTAIDGSTGGNGSPINLTYSFLDDGVWIPGSGEPGSPSSLYAELNGHFGSEAVWKAIFAGMFNDWGKHIGVTYLEVSDDGASFPGSPGVLGLRGDVRIGCHYIDGTNNVLAYNYFPNVGDMVMDSSEYWSAANNNYRFMRNILRHEHGHGIGLQHVVPEVCEKLMEAFLCTNFDGPQDDDIRGGMRSYGDTYELNNNVANATDLGMLEGTFNPEFPVSLTTSVDYDYFHFSTAGAALLNVAIDPIGFRYTEGSALRQTDEVMDLAFRVLGGTNGTDILIEVNDVGVGDTELLVDFTLPDAGDYWILIFRAAGTPDVQRYDLTIDVELTDILAVNDNRIPRKDLGLSLYPNPFNPRTNMRFYAAAPGPVTVDVYDVAGRLVRSLRDEAAGIGWQELAWDGRDNGGASVPSGAYLMQVQAGNRVQSVRGLLLE